MTSDAGESSSRLSDALAEIFAGQGSAAAADGRDDSETEAYVLPEIVPATIDVPVVEPESPRLPARSIDPQPPTAESPTVEAAPQSGNSVAASAAPTTVVAAPTTSVRSDQPAGSTTALPAAGWGEYMPAAPSASSQLRAPGRRPRVRRVTRVLRHIDPWSTFKIALLFNAVAYVVCLTSGVLLWRVADSTGTLDNVERWFTQFGWETFEINGDEVFHNAWIIGLFGVVAATGAAVLLVTLFNLVSDIVGGIRMTVLEEEVVERTISSTRRYVVRRPGDVAGAGGVAAADWSTDDLDADHPKSNERAAVDEPNGAASPASDRQTAAAPAATPAAPADWSVD